MSALMRQAALDAGMIDLDTLRLLDFSRDPPAEQIAAFKRAHPDLFYAAPMPNARTMTPEQVKQALAEMQRAEAKRQSDAASARAIERLQADRAAADALRDQRAMQMRERQANEQRRLAERHAAQRGR